MRRHIPSAALGGIVGALLLAGVAIAVAGCSKDDSSGGSGQPMVGGTGTIAMGVDSYCWLIDADGGGKYNPLYLPAQFQQAFLRVKFTAIVRTDLVSTCMNGQIVELTAIIPEP